jgi:diguanylate cyclase (GGDEF)-like protein
LLRIRRNSLSYKTAVLSIVLTVLLASVFNFIIWENQSELIIRNQQLIAENQSVRLARTMGLIAGRVSMLNAPSAWAKLDSMVRKEGLEDLSVYLENGQRIFGKGKEISADQKLLVNRAIAKLELEGKPFFHDLQFDAHRIDLYIPQALTSGEVAVALVPLPIATLEDDRSVLLRLCLFVTALVIALQVAFVMFLRGIIINPLAKLEEATHRISMGEFNQTIHIKQDDEIGLLANSFNEMLLNLGRIREEAKGSNPLSGLPGNNIIIKHIDEMIHNQRQFAVIYGDLDNFKAYNDKYGFSRGDDAILYTRDCFLEAAKKFGNGDTFVGHEGGDDFVIVTPFETWEGICKGITSSFDASVKQFYNESDAKQGYIDSMDRQGRRMRFPLMSISLAVASNHYREVLDHRMVVQIAAEMKKYVKKTEGSCYAIDKRTN